MRTLYVVLVFTFFTACSAATGNINEKNMSRAAADLIRLTYAVQGEIMRGAAPGDDLLALACGRDPALCAAVSEFHTSVKQDGDNAVLLLCTRDGGRALLEDIGCTPQIDFKPWEKDDLPCVFTLNAADVCP